MNSSASHPFSTRLGPPHGSRRVSPRLNDKCSSSRKWAMARLPSAGALDSAFAAEFPPSSLVVLLRAGRGVVA